MSGQKQLKTTLFKSSSKRTALLDDNVQKRFPTPAPTRWSYFSRLVETDTENMDNLKQLFECIIEGPERFDPKSIDEAQGFLSDLSSFDFNFLLLIYSTVFSFTEYLFNVFQSKSMDILLCCKRN